MNDYFTIGYQKDKGDSVIAICNNKWTEVHNIILVSYKSYILFNCLNY